MNCYSDPKLISVIIPIYNSERYLRDCLISVQQQTYKDIEIICVNDGSTDGSAAILDEFAEQDTRVRVVHRENGGITKARESGLLASQGRYVYFLDSDDMIHRDTLNTLNMIAEKHQADLICHRHQNVAESSTLELTSSQLKKMTVKSVKAEKGILSKNISILTCCKLYDRSLFEGFVFPDTSFAEDFYCTPILALKANTVMVCNQKLYYYRQHSHSLTGTFNEKKLQSVFQNADRMLKVLEDSGYSKSTINQIKKYAARYQLFSIATVILNIEDSNKLLSSYQHQWNHQNKIELKHFTGFKRLIMKNIINNRVDKARYWYQIYQKIKL